MGAITIAEIKQKPKRSIIVTSDGKQYGCWTDKLAKLGLEQGATYNVETESFETDSGNTLFNITAAKRVTIGVPDASKDSGTHRTPAAQPSGGNGYYRPTSPVDSERMFVCSLMNAFIQAGKIEPEQTRVVRAIEVLRNAYQATFGSDDIQHEQAAE
jgi:hypothetical protein